MINSKMLVTYPEPDASSLYRHYHRLVVVDHHGCRRTYTIAEFERLTGMRYLSHLEFTSKAVYHEVAEQCQRCIVNKTVSQKAISVGVSYADQIYKGFVNAVEIRWIDANIGYGLFAAKECAPGEFVGEYVGCVRKVPCIFGGVNEYFYRYPLYRTGFFVYAIDASSQCNEVSFINHGKENANCEAVVGVARGLFHVCIRTIRPVHKGEEFLFDYGSSAATTDA